MNIDAFANNYYQAATELKEIDLLIIGQDPYPKDANGVAFCKNELEQFFDESCCGKDLLFSLGMSEDFVRKGFANPRHCFQNLLVKHKICFINASNAVTKDMNETQLELILEESKEFNLPFLKKAKQIIILGTGKTKEYYHRYNCGIEYTEAVIHPTGRNKKEYLSQWKKIWGTNYLQIKYDIPGWIS